MLGCQFWLPDHSSGGISDKLDLAKTLQHVSRLVISTFLLRFTTLTLSPCLFCFVSFFSSSFFYFDFRYKTIERNSIKIDEKHARSCYNKMEVCGNFFQFLMKNPSMKKIIL